MSEMPKIIWAHEKRDGSRWFYKAECPSQAESNAIKYIRSDLHEALEAENARLRAQLGSAAFSDLRKAIRAGDIDAAERALNRCEPWADYVFRRIDK